MNDNALFPDEDSFTPRAAWRVIDAARHLRATAELTLPTSPAVRIFMRDGFIYFAERVTDGTLGIRLLVEGVLTRDQMQRGTVVIGGTEHLGRLFERVEDLDRATVEVCVELFAEEVLTSIAHETIDGYTLAMYKKHPAGIDRWYVGDSVVADVPVEVVATAVEAPVQAEVVAEPVAQVVDEPVAEIVEEPVAEVAEAAIVEKAVAEPVAEPVVEPATRESDELSVTWTISEPIPAYIPAAAPSATGPVLTSEPNVESVSIGFADDVTEAVRRALEAIDSAAKPKPSISPADFVVAEEAPTTTPVDDSHASASA